MSGYLYIAANVSHRIYIEAAFTNASYLFPLTA